jgi:ketosteroid isomerase-like protein
MSTTDARNRAGVIRAMFAAIDRAEDADELIRGLLGFLTDDVVFVIGNLDPLLGKEAVIPTIRESMAALRSIQHEIHHVWQAAEDPNVLIAQLTTHHTRLDGVRISLPGCHVLRMRGDLIAESRAYSDPTPLFAA